MNGTAPTGNWTGLFRPGEKLRLRFINGSSMTLFDLRIPGLKMTVIAADGQDVVPVAVDEFRIAVEGPGNHANRRPPTGAEDLAFNRRAWLPAGGAG